MGLEKSNTRVVEVIENDFLSVEVFLTGAELKSIVDKNTGKEYLWQGSSVWWPRRAPVLFPIVGKLKNNSYQVDGKTYTLPQHGFARDKDFKISKIESNLVELTIQSDEDTLKIYPYEFELKIGYQLIERSLSVSYEIINKGSAGLSFSIGAHPGFICPINENEVLADYYLEFEKEESLHRHLLSDGLFTGETEAVLENEKILNLNDGLFEKDAIVFKDMQSNSLTLKSRKSDYQLQFKFEHFPYFGIWTKPGAPFLCLEPWCGLADQTDFSGEFKDKEGVITLEPSKQYKRAYSIRI